MYACMYVHKYNIYFYCLRIANTQGPKAMTCVDDLHKCTHGAQPNMLWAHNCKQGPFCSAQRDGQHTWKDFSLTALWMHTCRTHAKYMDDMQVSEQAGFRKGRSPFACKSKLTLAPHFRWTMVKCDWMHAPSITYELFSPSVLPQC